MSRGVVEPPSTPPEAGEDHRRRPGRGGFVAVLANGAFLRLWLAQALSQTAQQTINFALLIQVRQIIEARGAGGGNTAISLLILSFATPPIFFSAVAGVIVDRSDKRNIMAAVNAARALCIAGYLFLNPSWPLLTTLIAIYALCLAFSSVGQFFGPAEGATIPLLVGKEQLISANALFSLTFIGSQLLGFVTLGPLLTALLGLRTIYIIVVLLYLFCTGLVLSLPTTPPAGRAAGPGAARRTVWGDLREVWSYVGHDRLLLKAIAYLTVANSGFLMLATLAPEFVITVLDLPTQRLATIVTPAGLGMVAGVVTVGRVARRADRERLVDRALIAVGLLLLAFATIPPALAWLDAASAAAVFTPPVIAAMILAGGLGVANAFIIVPSQTLLQERSEETIRARVLSTFFTASNAVALIPILFAGVLGDLFGVARVLVVIAILAVGVGLAAERRRGRGMRA
ncbi:MAG: MFS transporter [Chloroflexota bacterium]|nr:MFS transporter [Chloroflexota bacterium]